MSEWSSRITAQGCTGQLRRLVRMRFLYPPTILPRMVAMGFLSRRSASFVLFGRIETASAIIVIFGENPHVCAQARPLDIGLEDGAFQRS
jgi:hypothetical protein